MPRVLGGPGEVLGGFLWARYPCRVAGLENSLATIAITKILTSSNTGFADVNTAIFGGFADLDTAKQMELRTLIQRNYRFTDLDTAKK